MSLKRFFTLLVITLVASAAISFTFNALPGYSQYNGFIIGSILLFTVLSILVYFFGKMAATSNNKYLFIYLVMFNIIFKVFASFVLIILYIKTTQPPDRMFLMPFMFIYLVFTIFETIVMAKLAKLKPAE